MAQVSLHFEDSVDGLVSFRADFKDGYDPHSASHKLACVVVSFLDKECSMRQPVDSEQTDYLQNGAGHSEVAP